MRDELSRRLRLVLQRHDLAEVRGGRAAKLVDKMHDGLKRLHFQRLRELRSQWSAHSGVKMVAASMAAACIVGRETGV
jgi:hypothetical protein